MPKITFKQFRIVMLTFKRSFWMQAAKSHLIDSYGFFGPPLLLQVASVAFMTEREGGKQGKNVI
jgi:hypothetical protein